MKAIKPTTAVAALGLALGMMAIGTAQADTFGSGANTFTIDFVDVGNAGNANDAGAGGGSYFSDYGGVSYDYRMGTYEISQDMITKATASGLANVTAGAWTGSQPAASVTWYEAASIVNWLNTSTGHQAAYNLTYSGGWSMALWSSEDAWQAGGENLYRHQDAYYFLPSEDEWYKAAYHQNDGVTANYWDFATGSNTAPAVVSSGTVEGTAVYNSSTGGPAGVDNNGGLSPYGTRGQNGNVWEWGESAYDGLNNSPSEVRSVRGGGYSHDASYLRSSSAGSSDPALEAAFVGIRVASVPASVPEPSAALLVLLAGGAWLLWRRARRFPARG